MFAAAKSARVGPLCWAQPRLRADAPAVSSPSPRSSSADGRAAGGGAESGPGTFLPLCWEGQVHAVTVRWSESRVVKQLDAVVQQQGLRRLLRMFHTLELSVRLRVVLSVFSLCILDRARGRLQQGGAPNSPI